MRNRIAWTLTACVAASVVATASGQGQGVPQQPAAGKRLVIPPAPAKGQAPAAKAAAAAPTPEEIRARQAADQKAKLAMIPILAEWEKQSKKVTTLSVGFHRVDKSAAWGDEFSDGKAVLKAPNLACIEWQKAKLDGQGKPMMKPNAKGEPAWVLEPEPTERVVCNGKEVLQYAFAQRTLFVFPMEKDTRAKALQEGPLPFLFNMKAEEATRRYGMRLLQEDEREYLIAIVPNDPADRGNFERAFLWLKKSNYLPNKLRLYPVQGGQGQAAESQEFTFFNIDTVRPVADTFFNPPLKMAGWETKVNPTSGPDPAVRPAQGPAVGKRQAAQPAPKAGGRIQ